MPVVVVTRTVLARPRYFAPFGIGSVRVALQARRTPGYLTGGMLVSAGPTYWTMTVWRDGRSMTAFRDGGVHGAVMPMLAVWAREAAVSAWRTDDPGLPTWDEAARQLARKPRLVPVQQPNQNHLDGTMPAPGIGIKVPLPAPRSALVSRRSQSDLLNQRRPG